MRTNFIIKLNFLVLALVLVLFAIYKIRGGSLDRGVSAMLGIEAGQPEQNPKIDGVIGHLDWCDTRVSEIIRPNQPKLIQEKMKWIWEGNPSMELNFLAVEKWFAQFCEVLIDRARPVDFVESQAEAAMEVHFIKGNPTKLLMDKNGVYRWRNTVFRSAEMDAALQALSALPQQGSRTSH